jgi:hypothetical protein
MPKQPVLQASRLRPFLLHVTPAPWRKTPLKTACGTKGPDIKEPAPDDIVLRTGLKLGGFTVLDLRNLVAAFIVLVLACVRLDWVKREYPTAFWAAIIDGLRKLASLQSLNLTSCTALKNVDCLNDLRALRN